MRLGWAWIKLSPVDKFGKLNLDEAWLGLARLEALLRGTLPIFGINVSRTCPRIGLAWAWAWAGLSPADKFDGKLNLVDSAAQLDNYYFYSITDCLPGTEEPEGFPVQGWPLSSSSSSLSLFVWLVSCLSAFDSFGFCFCLFSSFTVYMCTWLCRFYVGLVLENFQKLV